jgi:hypothetical protein
MRFGASLELDSNDPALDIAEQVRSIVSQLSVA